MKRILYFIQLPPPVHGVTLINKQVFNSIKINENIIKDIINVNYSKSLSDLKSINLKKLCLFICLWWKLLTRLLKFKPEYIYYTLPPSGIGFYKELPNIILIKMFGVKPIYHLHGKGIAKKTNSNLKRKIYQYYFSNAIIINLSRRLYESEFKGITLKKTTPYFVPNGIETVIVNSESNTKSYIELLFISNIQKSKGIFLLLEVYLKLAIQFKNIRLNIIGDFRDVQTERTMNQFIKAYALERRIKMWGEKYGFEKHQIISNCDILIHPSYNDAFPLVILEGMQHGLAIIGSDQGAMPEIIKSDFGFVFPTGDFIRLCEFLKQLIINSNLRESMKSNARIEFYKYYTKEHFEDKMANIFSTL